ncbi:MAG: HAD family hydrolase [Pseudomonadota bacterium]
MRTPRLVVTDLDGTLLSSERVLDQENWQTLERLGEGGALRMIATGRSWHSANLVLTPEMPIDYLAFSSGAGLVSWATGALVQGHHLSAADTEHALQSFAALDISCFVQHPVPDNHRFSYWRGSKPPNDFVRRLDRYQEFATEIRSPMHYAGTACQLLGVLPPNQLVPFEKAKAMMPRLNVFRATSPLDHESIWVEVFPLGVSKAAAANWVATQHGVAHEHTLAIGNDFNDLDLLRWAQTSFVVANAPPDLRAEFRSVRSNDAGGFSHAVATWEGERR